MSHKVKRQVSIFQLCEQSNTNVLWIRNWRHRIAHTHKHDTAHAHVHSADGSTFLHDIITWKYDVISEIRFCQSMHIHLKNNHAKCHPDPFWNDRTLSFFWNVHHKNSNMSRYGISSWSNKLHYCHGHQSYMTQTAILHNTFTSWQYSTFIIHNVWYINI